MLSIELDPLERPLPQDPNVFEFGLVLAGAISAGAYIGGVMDFLIETLDAWEKARADDLANTPDHRAILRVITGASAGGMNGALAAAALGYAHQPVSLFTQLQGAASPNRFYDAWVKQIDILKLLTRRDLDRTKGLPPSLLDSTELDTIAASVFSVAPGSTSVVRPWVADPLRIAVTLGDLNGVPYSFMLRAAPGVDTHGLRVHSDHIRFALSHAGGQPDTPARPDEIILAGLPNTASSTWGQLSRAALASGAFPVFLSGREISRSHADYANRVYSIDFAAAPPAVTPHAPDPITPPAPATHRLLAVDGGTMNNEPMDLARVILAGAAGRNPREAMQARRAYILVDPFPEPPDVSPSLFPTNGLPASFAAIPSAMLGAWKNQCRFKPADLALARSETIFSRFLITPSRGEQTAQSKGKHLASGLLGGFGGFLAEEMRFHDYHLGRRNCERFLREHFTLPENHALFASWNQKKALIARLRTLDSKGKPHLPIIPVLTPASQSQPLPEWPTNCVQKRAPEITRAILDRADAVIARMTEDLPWYQNAYLWPLKRVARGKLEKLLEEQLQDARRNWSL